MYAIEIFCAFNVSTFFTNQQVPRNKNANDNALFQVGEGEDKATMFSKCKMSLAKQVSFDLLANMDSVLALLIFLLLLLGILD